MNIKKISIIILSILAISNVIGCIAYKMHMESSKQQNLKIQHIKENTHKSQQIKIQQVDKGNNERNHSDNISKKIESVDENKLNQVKKEKETTQINNIKKKTLKERSEYYYKKIKDAKNKQTEYINSFNNPEEKQSLQTPQSAAIGEATLLEMKYPEDTNIVEESLKKVLDGK